MSSFAHALTTVGTSPVQVSPASTGFNQYSMVIQNNHGSNTVYVGTSSVSSSSYGVALSTGASVSLDDLPASMAIYVVASASGTPVSTITIIR